MNIGDTVYHSGFKDRGRIVGITPDTILVRWRTHTVSRVTPELTIHHSHVYPRSVRVIRP